MIDIHLATLNQYRASLFTARFLSERIEDATSKPEEMPVEARYFLTADGKSGFGITDDGDLIGLFSLVKGRGDSLVGWAVRLGAETLDCFDGFLPKFYESFGFAEVKRESNWTAGGPDVVYMSCI